MTDPVTIDGLDPLAQAQAGDKLPVSRAGVAGSVTADQVVDLARETLIGAEVSVRGSLATGATSGHVDMSSVTDGAAYITGGAPKYLAADVAATGNVNIASPGSTIDGVSMTVGKTVLLPLQTAAAECGKYDWNGAAVPMTRSADCDSAGHCDDDISVGQKIYVRSGTANGGSSWSLTASGATPIVLGTTSLTYTKDGSATVWNTALGNPSQTFKITGFDNLAGITECRFGGEFLLDATSPYLSFQNGGKDLLTEANACCLLIPLGGGVTRIRQYEAPSDVIVFDRRGSNGAGSRCFNWSGDPDALVPGMAYDEGYSIRKFLSSGRLGAEPGDTMDDGHVAANKDGSGNPTAWSGVAMGRHFYATYYDGTRINLSNASRLLYAGSTNSCFQGWQARFTDWALETSTQSARGGAWSWGWCPLSTDKVIGDVTVGAQGNGYTTASVAVVVDTGFGFGGTITPVIGTGGSAGKIIGYTVTNPGRYTGTVHAVVSGDGTGATCTINLVPVTMPPDRIWTGRYWMMSAGISAVENAGRAYKGFNYGGVLKNNFNVNANVNIADYRGCGHWEAIVSPKGFLEWSHPMTLASDTTKRAGWLYNDTAQQFEFCVENAGVISVVYAVPLSGKVITKPNAPAFSAIVNSNVLDVTGDATAYSIIFGTELYDRGANYDPTTGAFTAPVTGLYQFNISVQLGGVLSAHTDFYCSLVTSGRTFALNNGDLSPGAVGTGQVGMCRSLLATMTAGDTAYVQIQVNGSTKVVDVIAGTNATNFSGFLVA